MSKWSSYKEDQLITESWRSFLNEQYRSKTGAYYTTTGADTKTYSKATVVPPAPPPTPTVPPPSSPTPADADNAIRAFEDKLTGPRPFGWSDVRTGGAFITEFQSTLSVIEAVGNPSKVDDLVSAANRWRSREGYPSVTYETEVTTNFADLMTRANAVKAGMITSP